MDHAPQPVHQVLGLRNPWQAGKRARQPLSSGASVCRVHAQVILQALLHRFPQLCEGADSQLAAVSAFFGCSPSMRKLDKVKQWLLRELRPETTSDPWRVFREVGLPCQ